MSGVPDRLRIAVVGAGAIGRVHMACIAASPACRLAAVADPAPAARSLAEQAGVPFFPDLGALLHGTPLDGVVLASPNRDHVPGALACIEAGVPVLVEKPVADSVADAELLVQVERRSGVPVLVGHHRRHSAILERARELIASGELGRVVAVSGSATFHKPAAYFSEAPWRRQPGGGPILINLVHEIDAMRVLVGDIVEVQAFASSAVRGFEVEDTAAINLRFANGALGSFLLSDTAASPASWELTSGENPAYAHQADTHCYLISGDRGSLAVPTMQLRRYAGECSWFEPLELRQLPVEPADPLARQLAHFCAVIRRETPPRVTARDATESLRVTLAVAQAARSGRPVTLALEPDR